MFALDHIEGLYALIIFLWTFCSLNQMIFWRSNFCQQYVLIPSHVKSYMIEKSPTCGGKREKTIYQQIPLSLYFTNLGFSFSLICISLLKLVSLAPIEALYVMMGFHAAQAPQYNLGTSSILFSQNRSMQLTGCTKHATNNSAKRKYIWYIQNPFPNTLMQQLFALSVVAIANNVRVVFRYRWRIREP